MIRNSDFTTSLQNNIQSATSYIYSLSKKISVFHITIIFIIYVIFSIVAGGSGILHREMDVRLPAHISGRPILQIIFDADSMNIGGWEARQLSFLFDILDGNFVAWCIRLGYPHFRSLTHYLFTFIIVIYLWLFMTNTLKANRLLSIILISLLLTTPSFIYSYYYRTSKIGITVLVIFLLGEIYKITRGETYLNIKIPKHFWLGMMFLFATLALMLFDILGGFFASFIIAYLFLSMLYKPDKNKISAFSGMIIGYAIWVFYFLYLGQIITFAISGKRADTSFLTGAPFAALPNFLIADILPLMTDMLRYLFGYISTLLGSIELILILEIALWLSIRSNKKAERFLNPKDSKKLPQKFRAFIARYEPIPSLFFLAGSIAIVYDFLVTRHPPLLWPDVRPTYYIMPAQAAILFGITILLTRAKSRWFLKEHKRLALVTLIFAFLLIGNVIGSIRIKDVLIGGPNTRINLHDPSLLKALANLKSPEYQPDRAILDDPIYILFSTQK
ncbi:MAG: hypothetical protein IPP66_16540 [Anaerolineales bacterium]|nr:hypothetical protein [Anaerolineales bacterium]